MNKLKEKRICKVEGCENKHLAKGYCMKHYMHNRIYGNPLPKFIMDHAEYCSIPGCNNKYAAKGYCHKHYNRWKRYNDPLYIKIEMHGLSHTSEYMIWKDMKDRCYNKNNKYYHRYGGRGITVCDKWQNSFLSFYANMGKRPFSKATIDRIDNNGNYTPENCHWVTCAENIRNSAVTKLNIKTVEALRNIYKTKKITIKELAELYKIDAGHVGRIINYKNWKLI